MPSSPQATARPLRGEKIAVIVIAVVFLAHSVFVALWVAPPNSISTAVGESNISAYVDPYFKQSWDNFSPAARTSNQQAQIRAYIRDAKTGEKHATKWKNPASDDAPDLGRINLIGPRLSRRLAQTLKPFNEKQLAVAAADYLTADDGSLDEKLRAAGKQTGSPVDPVFEFLKVHAMTVRFGSMYARAVFEGKVLRVQYRVRSRAIPASRDAGTAEFETVFTSGWLAAFRAPPEAQRGFETYGGP